MMPVSDLTQLIRPEALQGKAYARLSHPLLIANYSLKRPLWLALLTAAAIVVLMAFVPITNSYRGVGVVSAASNSLIVRATKSGQLIRAPQVGQLVSSESAIAVVEQLVQTEAGESSAKYSAVRLKTLSTKRERDLHLLADRYGLSLASASEAERSIKERIDVVEASLKNQRDLLVETEAFHKKLSSLAGYVTRFDTLSIAERTANVRNRTLDLQAELKKLRIELSGRPRDRRVMEIDYVREAERIRHQYETEENELLEKTTNQTTAIAPAISGEIRAVYKAPGDWVMAGDEIALVSANKPPIDSSSVTVSVPANQANILKHGQLARVWPSGARKGYQPLLGFVHLIEQRTPEGYRVRIQQPGGAPGSFVAHVTLQSNDTETKLQVGQLRVGSEVDVEIVFGSEPLYYALLPRRLTSSFTQSGPRHHL